MNSLEEKYIGEGKPNKAVQRTITWKLKENTVGTEHLKDGAITSDKMSSDFVEGFAEDVTEKALALLRGRVVANKFGNNTDITISQKLLTDTINDIYSILRDILGEPPIGLYLTVSPEYFIGEEGCNVHIDAISTTGIFERIAVYVDGRLLPGAEAENVYRFQFDTTLSDTSVIRCEATIFGVDYVAEKQITHYSSFWLGAGTAYTDIMDIAHTIPVEEMIRGAFDVTCHNGDHIIIIVGDTLKGQFIRADLNGVEIVFDRQKITVDNNDYWVLTSENVYKAGTYNIDING